MPSNTEFREVCHRHNLAATHQRQVIYETIVSTPGHPSPETVYARVQKKIPSISLATVYKNIRTFLDSGLLQEVSLHHGSLRLETNDHPHHHLVCIRCKSILDLDDVELNNLRLGNRVPKGFQVKRIAVDILGVCKACSSKTRTAHKLKFKPNS